MTGYDPDFADRAYDEYIDRIVMAQKECPYFEQRGIEIEPGDDKFCQHEMEPCEHGRIHCPLGKW